MNKENFIFEVHCRNANETRNVINHQNNELFRYDDDYSDMYDYFASYLNDIEDGPYVQFKADDNNPYSSPDVEGFEEFLYRKLRGIYIQFKVANGEILDWGWDDKPDEKYTCLEYNDFMSMINSIENIVTSDIVDEYYNKSNDNNTEDMTIKSTHEVNFDILFDYGTMIGIGDRFVRKSDISAFDRENLADTDGYSTVVVLKSGVKLTFHDIDYEDFVAELDKYYRFRGDIFV